MKRKYKYVRVSFVVIVCLIAYFSILLLQEDVIYHNEIIGTYITYVNGDFVRTPPIIFYDSRNPYSVELQLVDYKFDGKALSWNVSSDSILFTEGDLSKISGYRDESPVWYDIEYNEIRNIFGIHYCIINAELVEPQIINHLDETNAELIWV